MDKTDTDKYKTEQEKRDIFKKKILNSNTMNTIWIT